MAPINLVSSAPQQDPSVDLFDGQHTFSIIQNVYQSQDSQDNSANRDPASPDNTAATDSYDPQTSYDTQTNYGTQANQDAVNAQPAPDPAANSVIDQVFQSQAALDKQASQPQPVQDPTPPTSDSTPTISDPAPAPTADPAPVPTEPAPVTDQNNLRTDAATQI